MSHHGRLRLPLDAQLPYFAEEGGIAFGKAGMRGVYQTGLVHALVISGYYPGTAAGTSIGALNATLLAMAADLETQAERLELLEDFIGAWLANPARAIVDRLMSPDSKGRALVRDLADIRLSLEQLIELGQEARRSKGRAAWAAAKLASSLPFWRPCMAKALLNATTAALDGVARGHLGLRIAQAFLDAYGIGRGLLKQPLVEIGFGTQLDRWLPERMGDLRTHLIFQATHIDAEGAPLVMLKAPETRLRPALQATAAIPPLFRPVDYAAVEPGKRGALLDAAGVEKAPLDPVVFSWKDAGRGALDHDLLIAYLNPLDAPAQQESGDSFFGPGLRALELFGQQDMEFNAKVIRFITKLVVAIEEAGAPVPEVGGQRYLKVNTVAVAPREFLPVMATGYPRDDELRVSLQAGCSAGLEAVHAERLEQMARAHPGGVPCAGLMSALKAAHPEAQSLFAAAPSMCEGCPGLLSAPIAQEERESYPGQLAPDASPPFREELREDRPLTVAVPAGGVFLGVFQLGAIAALDTYGERPDLYAGASVGTLFSYLMDATRDDPKVLPELVDLMRTLPTWFDATPSGVGRVDRWLQTYAERWKSPEMRAFRALRPRRLVDALFGEDAVVEAGIGRFVFTPMVDLETGKARGTLDPAPEWSVLRQGLLDLARMRYGEARSVLDLLAQYAGFYEPGEALRGQMLNLDNTAVELRRIVFGDTDWSMDSFADARQTRFIFTVTNTSRGRLEHLGAVNTEGEVPVDPIEASLTASSLPLVFRRRHSSELFETPVAPAFYADGGILNNFPTDSAISYLHRTSELLDYQWLGERRHRVLLLHLNAPAPLPRGRVAEKTVYAALRATAFGDEQKVRQTHEVQTHINRLAPVANPILRARGEGQAIVVDFVSIAPSYAVYSHPFAFKRQFGFSDDKQLEMIAAGCRHTRRVLEGGRALPVLSGAPVGATCLLEGTAECPFNALAPLVQIRCYATAHKDQHRSPA